MLLFQEALGRLGLAPARVVPYVDIVAGRASLAPHLEPGSIVRVESPGKSWDTERALIARGARAMEEGREPGDFIDERGALALSPAKGRIWYLRQAYLGFRDLCGQIARELAAAPGVRAMNSPGEIPVMFDKRLCHARFMEAGVPVPRSLGEVGSFEELMERMRDRKIRRVFVKLAHGSSASGVVALRASEGEIAAITTVERVRRGGATVLYNSRALRRYTKPPEIADIIDILCREGVHAEAWLPKAKIGGRPFDVRVVTIGGAAAHSVVRIGKSSPITNLHLGNPRGDVDAMLSAIGRAAWEEAKIACERAAALFPGSLYAGVDILLRPSAAPPARARSERPPHAILEINAFGDLLPGVLHAGEDTYEAEIKAVLRSPGPV